MKPGTRVTNTVSMARYGGPVSGVQGTVLEYVKPKKYTVKTGFGREKHFTPGRVKIKWDSGHEGWFDESTME